MIDPEQITSEITKVGGTVRARERAGGVVIDIPDPLWPHGRVSVLVKAVAEGFRLSDGGAASRQVNGGLETLAGHALCAGLDLRFGPEDELYTLVPAEAAGRLTASIIRFAAEISAAPTMARLIDCATPETAPSPPARTHVMASECRKRLLQHAPSLRKRNRVKLDAMVIERPVRVKAKLLIQSAPVEDRPATPKIACEFIDLGVGDASVTHAYYTASGVFRALGDSVEQQFLVAHGPQSAVEELGSVFDRDGVVTVRSNDLEAIYSSIDELEGRPSFAAS